MLDNSDAPERFDYDYASTTPVKLEMQEDGSVAILDDAGGWLGGVRAPWAFDAAGTSVPTHFEVTGATLTQVVAHKSSDFAYPISADPWNGRNIWSWSSIDSFRGDTRVNLRPADWAVGIWPAIFIDHGWPEALNRSNALRNALNSKATMRQEFDCHAFGSAFAGDWNLERFRPNRTAVWSSGVAVHRCNWTTANQY